MTAPSQADEFLRIESAAERLLDDLTSLRAETVTFREAHTTLGAAAASVGALAASLAETVAVVSDAVRQFREIGTPQLLAQQARLTNQLDDVVRLLGEHGAQLRALEAKVAPAEAVSAPRALRSPRWWWPSRAGVR